MKKIWKYAIIPLGIIALVGIAGVVIPRKNPNGGGPHSPRSRIFHTLGGSTPEHVSDKADPHGKKGSSSQGKKAFGVKSRASMMSPGFMKLGTNDAKKTAKKFSSDPEMLAGIFSLNQDAEISGLLKTHGNSPAALSALALFDRNLETRLGAAKALQQLEPDNLLGGLMEADVLLRQGNENEALARMEKSLSAEHGRIDLSLFQKGQDAARASLKLDEVDRGLLRSADPSRKAAFDTIGYLMIRSLNEGEMQEDRLSARASQGLELLHKISESVWNGGTIVAGLEAFGLEETILRSVPGDYQYDSATAGERAEQLAAKAAALKSYQAEVTDVLDRSSEPLIKEYYRVSREKGECRAAKEVLSIPVPAQLSQGD